MEHTIWLLCNYCTRAFTSADALTGHKTIVHPTEFYRSFPQNRRRSTRRLTVNSGKENIESTVNNLLSPIKEVPAKINNTKRKSVKPSTSLKKKTSESSETSSISSQHVDENSNKLNPDVQDELPNDQEEEPTKNSEPQDVDISKEGKKRVQASCRLPPLPKASADAFKILFNSSLKMKENAANTKSTSVKLRSSTRTRNNNNNHSPSVSTKLNEQDQQPGQLTPRKTFECPHCPRRQLADEEALKQHLKLHESINFNNTSIEKPCQMCKKIMTSSPYKCIDCPAMKMVMDFPKVVVKEEPLELSNSDNFMDLEYDDSNLEDEVNDPFKVVQVEAEIQNKRRKLSESNDTTPRKYFKTPTKETHTKENVRLVSRSISNTSSPGMKLNGSNNIFNCGFCSQSFTDPKVFRSHHESMHAPGGNRLYNCKVCDQHFKTRGDRNSHQKSHEAIVEDEQDSS